MRPKVKEKPLGRIIEVPISLVPEEGQVCLQSGSVAIVTNLEADDFTGAPRFAEVVVEVGTPQHFLWKDFTPDCDRACSLKLGLVSCGQSPRVSVNPMRGVLRAGLNQRAMESCQLASPPAIPWREDHTTVRLQTFGSCGNRFIPSG
jgi:hypothetical protein